MDLPRENEYITKTMLVQFLDKYPEDSCKWFDFLNSERYEVGYSETSTSLEDRERINILYNTPCDKPIDNVADGCLLCKKSWLSTQGTPTMTHICGHTYHTICVYIDHIKNDTPSCIVEGCDIHSWDYANNIVNSKNIIKDDTENILFDSYQKRKDFKQDIKDLKSHVSSILAAYNKVNSLMSLARKELIHKHIYTINQIQEDLNATVKTVKQSESMNRYNTLIRQYRKKASYIFRKYHLSFRNLLRRRIINVPWNIRRVLERHLSPFSRYKLSLRIKPGLKRWRDPF
jgi:hypothetical protein